MNSKNWKSLALVASLALGLSACANDEEKAPPSNPYAGVWALQSPITLYRTYGKDINLFCPKILRAMAGKKVDGREVNPRLNPYIVQTNGEVFKYSSVMTMDQQGYRDAYYQGVVNDKGQFFIGGSEQASFQQMTAVRPGIIADRSRWSVDNNRTVLTVYKSRKNLYFIRTSTEEMDGYLATRQTCEDMANQKSHDDGDDRAAQADEDHEETEFEMEDPK